MTFAGGVDGMQQQKLMPRLFNLPYKAVYRVDTSAG